MATLWERTKQALNVFSGNTAAATGGVSGTKDNLASLLEDQSAENCAKQFKNMYRNSPLTQAICDKVQGLLLGKGWKIAVDEDLPQPVQDAIMEFWEAYRVQWADMVLEGIIAGFILEEPLVNPRYSGDVKLSYVPAEAVEKVLLDNGDVTQVQVRVESDELNPQNTGRYAEWVPIKKQTSAMAGTSFKGDVFYTRIGGLPSDRYGLSQIKAPLRTIAGYEDVTSNIYRRSRVAQALAWQVLNSQERSAQEKAAFDRDLQALANGENRILIMENEERLEPVTPDIRQLDLPEYRIAMLEAVLARFELPPDLLGHPDASNRATLETAVRGYVQRYEKLQDEFKRHLVFRLDYVATQANGGMFVENCCTIDAPAIFVQTIGEAIADQQKQQAYLLLLYQQGVIPYAVFVEQSRRVLKGEKIDMEGVELPEPGDAPPQIDTEAQQNLLRIAAG